MISYVFWHSPRLDVFLDTYEHAHREFLEALSESPPRGLLSTVVFRVQQVPWVHVETQAYEDWYLLDSSAALDLLNDAASNGSTRKAHDRIAPMSASGTAGLYRLRLGSPSSHTPAVAHWFSKPQGMTYRELYASLTDLCSRPGVSLWGRQMVLGPAPEFCLHTTTQPDAPFPGLTVPLSPFFSGSC